MDNVESWTDYIYVGNMTESAILDTALVISPPENHGGQYGYVLFSDCTISRLPASQVRQLIKDPFCMATNESPNNIAYERLRVAMNVPKRLKSYYPPGSVYPTDPNIVNLSAIWVLLCATVHGVHVFASNLAELGPSVNSNLFVCPDSGGRPGPMGEIEEWTDYIYVGGMLYDAPNAALVISPPENHGGKYGYVLFADATISRLEPGQIRQLIKNPFCMATNEASNIITHAKERVIVNIPTKLKPYYQAKEM